MKAHGHTGTLFIQAWKYKWSYDHEHCTECGKCDFKHKSKWLCTRCYDRKRSKSPARQKVLEGNRKRWAEKNKEAFKEYQNKWHTQYYHKNKEAIDLLAKGRRYKKAGKPILIVHGKPIPFMELEKPPTTTHPRYAEWKRNDEIFWKLTTFLQK